MMRSRLFLFARFLDMLWWVCMFAFTYDAYASPASRIVVGMVLFRWVIRGLTNVAIVREREMRERSQDYGTH